MKKVKRIIKDILVTLVVIIALFMVVFTTISITTFNREDRSLFGYKALVVLTDSMSATDFKSGDLILIKDVDPETLEVGDIISFKAATIENYYEIVTHKIRKKIYINDGEPAFITYGTTNDVNDNDAVTYDNVVGKYVKTFPNVGRFFQFLKTTKGYILCILIPFLILILLQAVNCARLFFKYRKETKKEIRLEKARIKEIEEENVRLQEELDKKNQKVLKVQKELKKLKEELKEKNASSTESILDITNNVDGKSLKSKKTTKSKTVTKTKKVGTVTKRPKKSSESSKVEKKE